MLRGGLAFIKKEMEVMPMKKRKKRKISISLIEKLTFGIFHLALLTFVTNSNWKS